MAIQNATDVTLSIGAEAMAHATSCSLSVNSEVRDATTKDSGGWSAALGGLRSWEMSGDAFVDIAATDASMADCFDFIVAGASTTVIFTIDSQTYTGSAFVTSVSADAGVEENATYSISLTGTGSLSKS